MAVEVQSPDNVETEDAGFDLEEETSAATLSSIESSPAGKTRAAAGKKQGEHILPSVS